MQAIRTRYYGPTNTRGSRIVAKCEAGTFTMPFDYSLGIEANHAKAARLMLEKLGWSASVYQSGVFDHDYYWVRRDTWAPAVSIDDAQLEAA